MGGGASTTSTYFSFRSADFFLNFFFLLALLSARRWSWVFTILSIYFVFYFDFSVFFEKSFRSLWIFYYTSYIIFICIAIFILRYYSRSYGACYGGLCFFRLIIWLFLTSYRACSANLLTYSYSSSLFPIIYLTVSLMLFSQRLYFSNILLTSGLESTNRIFSMKYSLRGCWLCCICSTNLTYSEII